MIKYTIYFYLLLLYIACEPAQPAAERPVVAATPVADSLCQPKLLPDAIRLMQQMETDASHATPTPMTIQEVDCRQTAIHRMLIDSSTYNGGSLFLAYDKKYDEMFAKVKCIKFTNYKFLYYKHKLDGFIEEWLFPSNTDVQQIYTFLKNEQKSIGFPFIKTASFYVMKENSLIMFHSEHPECEYINREVSKKLAHLVSQ